MCIAINILKTIQEKFQTAKDEYNRLRQELSTVDKTISDILHELEFIDALSASQGYKYAKMLKNLRQDRRDVKNELEELQILQERLNDFNVDKLGSTLISLESRQKNRIYNPRVLTPEQKKVMFKII